MHPLPKGTQPRHVPVLQVDVAEGDDVLAGEVVQIGAPLPGHAHRRDAEFLTGRRLAALRHHVTRHNHQARRGRRRTDELPTRNR
jgi:hypothetical protein